MRLASYRGRQLPQLIVLIFVLAAILYPNGEISAALVTIPGLFNTGVDDDGNKLKDEDPEAHYILTGVDDGAFVISDGSKPTAWVPSLGQSAWIGPENGAIDVAVGDYYYTLTFDLSGLIPSTAEISGRWASDNASEIFLNGVGTNNKRDTLGFLSLLDFKIESQFFIAGINSLEFRVVNSTSPEDLNPSGLLVLDLMGTASEVPIPGAIWLLGSAMIALVGIKRSLRD